MRLLQRLHYRPPPTLHARQSGPQTALMERGRAMTEIAEKDLHQSLPATTTRNLPRGLGCDGNRNRGHVTSYGDIRGRLKPPMPSAACLKRLRGVLRFSMAPRRIRWRWRRSASRITASSAPINRTSRPTSVGAPSCFQRVKNCSPRRARRQLTPASIRELATKRHDIHYPSRAQ